MDKSLTVFDSRFFHACVGFTNNESASACCDTKGFALNDLRGRFHSEQAAESFPVIGAGKIVHEEIHGRTCTETKLRDSQQNGKGVRVVTSGAELRQEHGEQAENDDRNGQHEELDRQSDEHFRHGDLFSIGDLGGSLSAPFNGLLQPDSGDDGCNENDEWNSHRDEKPVEHSTQNLQHSLVPKIVVSDEQLPGLSLGTHLVEARHLVLGSDDKAEGHQDQHADHDDGRQHLGRDAPLRS